MMTTDMWNEWHRLNDTAHELSREANTYLRWQILANKRNNEVGKLTDADRHHQVDMAYYVTTARAEWLRAQAYAVLCGIELPDIHTLIV